MQSNFSNTLSVLNRQWNCGLIASDLDRNAMDLTTADDNERIIQYASQRRRSKLPILRPTTSSGAAAVVAFALVRNGQVEKKQMSDVDLLGVAAPIESALGALARNRGVVPIRHLDSPLRIITRSDMSKLAARIYYSTIMTHLELLLFYGIQVLMGHSWMQQLSDSEKKRARSLSISKTQSVEPDRMLGYTSLSNKLKVFRKWYQQAEREIEGWEKDDQAIVELRNRLFHGAELADDLAGVDTLLNTLRVMRLRIGVIEHEVERQEEVLQNARAFTRG